MDLATLRAQTSYFIGDDPTSITLTRGSSPTPDGAGGTTTTPTPVPAQVVKVSQQRANSGVERRNQDGEVVRPEIVLVCEWDADILKDDTFTWNGLNCEVVWVTDLKYVKHGEVAVL